MFSFQLGLTHVMFLLCMCDTKANTHSISEHDWKKLFAESQNCTLNLKSSSVGFDSESHKVL